MQFATLLCDACGTPSDLDAAEKHAHVKTIRFLCGRLQVLNGHPLFLCFELLLLVVIYSSSGCHSSGWKSGFRKCAVLK